MSDSREAEDARLAAVMRKLLMAQDCPCELGDGRFGFSGGGTVAVTPAERRALGTVLLLQYVEPEPSDPRLHPDYGMEHVEHLLRDVIDAEDALARAREKASVLDRVDGRVAALRAA